MNRLFSVLLVLGLCIIAVNTMHAQFTVNIYATDSLYTDTLIIGNIHSPVYTDSTDSDTSKFHALAETELPPPPFTGIFDVRSINWGTGTVNLGVGQLIDIRRYYRTNQTDSFLVAWQVTATDNKTHDMLALRWDSAKVAAGPGYFHLLDALTGGSIFNIDMKTQFTFNVPAKAQFFIIYGDPTGFQTVSYFRLMNERNEAGAYKATKPAIKKTPNVLPNVFTLLAEVDKSKPAVTQIGSDATKSVIFKKTADMLKSLYTLKTNAYHKAYNLHCLDSAYNQKPKKMTVKDTAGVKHTIYYPAPIAKQLKSLVPDTLKGAQNNGLFAQLTIAKINVLLNDQSYSPKTLLAGFTAKIVQGHTTNFADLLINATDAANPLHKWHGKKVSELITAADNAISCVGAPSTATLGEFQTALEMINKSFIKADADTGIYTTSVAKFDTAKFWFGDTKANMTGWDKVYRIQGLPIATVGYLVMSLPSVAGGSSVPHAVAAGTQPKQYSLEQNYPNPFNPTTQIAFNLIDKGYVTVKVFNMLGQEVATLANHEEMAAGSQEVTFNASDFASGAYFYRIIVNDEAGAMKFQAVKKMMLVK